MNGSRMSPIAAAALLWGASACASSSAPSRGPDATAERYAAPTELASVADFGENPGNLAMYEYVPEGMEPGAPLVVVLHGCSQDARAMLPSGWNQLADEYGFAVAYAEQQSGNNPIGCFNWAGEYGDTANLTRGQGENQSVASMVESAIARHQIDPGRVYIAGFSAGGAFAAVMLATWPELFEAGAVMSGVPYRCAQSVQGAFDCQKMNQHPERKRTPAAWGDLVRQAHPDYGGAYPRVSVWHGTADSLIVSFENMAEVVEQWTDVHGADLEPETVEEIAGHQHRSYEAGGRVVVESYAIEGMGHAIAYGPDDPAHPCGPDLAASYYEDRGVCSTYRVASFFGLTADASPGGECSPGDPGCDEPGPGGDGEEPPDGEEPAGDDGAPEAPHFSGCAAGDGSQGRGVLALALLSIGASARRRRRRRQSEQRTPKRTSPRGSTIRR